MRKQRPVEPVIPIFNREDLPIRWELPSIGDICLPVEKVNPRDNADNEFTYIDISSIDNKQFRIVDPKRYVGGTAPSRARQLIRYGDTVFSTVRTYLKNFARVPQEYDGEIASTGFCVLRPAASELSAYLFYFIQFESLLNELAKFQRGTSYPAVRDSDVLAQFIPLPPIGEVFRIVAEIEKQFSRLDEAEANLKRVQANLKRYKAAVLKAAVEGKLTEEWRKQQVEAASCRLKRRDAASTIEPADKLLKRILAERRAKRNGKIDFSETRFVGETYYKSLDPFRRPEQGDLLYTLVGSFGIPVRVKTNQPFCIQRHIAILRPHEKSPMKYLSIAMAASNVYKQAASVATGTAQKTVPLAGLRKILIPLPPLAEQELIVTEVDQCLSVVHEIEAQVNANLRRANRLRQSILQKAFSGQLVPQNPNDEPASVLLQRIRESRKIEAASPRSKSTPKTTKRQDAASTL